MSAPWSTISWQGAFETVFGSESAMDFSLRSPLTLATSPCGGCISRTSSSLAATSSSRSTPKAMHMRFSVPNWLMRSGCCEPLGFSKRSAGPPDFTTRSVISVISRSGSTSAEMRCSSPSRSRSAIQSRRSRGVPLREPVYGASVYATAPSSDITFPSRRQSSRRRGSGVAHRAGWTLVAHLEDAAFPAERWTAAFVAIDLGVDTSTPGGPSLRSAVISAKCLSPGELSMLPKPANRRLLVLRKATLSPSGQLEAATMARQTHGMVHCKRSDDVRARLRSEPSQRPCSPALPSQTQCSDRPGSS